MKLINKKVLSIGVIILCAIFILPSPSQAKVTKTPFTIYMSYSDIYYSTMKIFFPDNRGHIRHLTSTLIVSGDMKGTVTEVGNLNMQYPSRDAIGWGTWKFVSDDGNYAWIGSYTVKITNLWVPKQYTMDGQLVAYGLRGYSGMHITADYFLLEYPDVGGAIIQINGIILNQHA